MKSQLHRQVSISLTNHPIQHEELSELMDSLSEKLRNVGHAMVEYCPPGRELSLALTKLQEARMFAIAAIACNQEEAIK